MKWRKGATGWGFSVRRKDGLFVALLVIVFRGYTPAKLRHHLFHVAAAKQVKFQASTMYIREQIIAAEAAATAVLEGGVPLKVRYICIEVLVHIYKCLCATIGKGGCQGRAAAVRKP
jgi:hypothetical protein